ncbi:MAG: acetyl-CoA carboxylase biotin carboxyl carrier protein [Acidobacteria bacterium]|nr:acetyl-CoA carboxylase biotin carboxyl carrier protein [Acidobacteriota bacterium]
MLSNEEVDALIRFVADERRGGSDLSIEYQVDGLYLRVGGDRGGGAGGPRMERASAAAPATATPVADAVTPTEEEEEPALDGHVLSSPIVGTFYVAPSPDAPAYVEVGSSVEKGQVVCIVEAMKLMNEIEADVSGVVTTVVPGNGDAVEFGAPLFVIQT